MILSISLYYKLDILYIYVFVAFLMFFVHNHHQMRGPFGSKSCQNQPGLRSKVSEGGHTST